MKRQVQKSAQEALSSALSDEKRCSPQSREFEDNRLQNPVQRILNEASSPYTFIFNQNKNEARPSAPNEKTSQHKQGLSQGVAQRVSTINSKDLTNANIAFANSFYDYHWATTEDDAKYYSLKRMEKGFRGQNNTVIEGSLADIKAYIKDVDFELAGDEDKYVTFTVKAKHWQVSTLVGANENKIGSCKSYNSNVDLKGYLKKSGTDVKKILVTGVAA